LVSGLVLTFNNKFNIRIITIRTRAKFSKH
jgi:hypothetical protein